MPFLCPSIPFRLKGMEGLTIPHLIWNDRNGCRTAPGVLSRSSIRVPGRPNRQRKVRPVIESTCIAPQDATSLAQYLRCKEFGRVPLESAGQASDLPTWEACSLARRSHFRPCIANTTKLGRRPCLQPVCLACFFFSDSSNAITQCYVQDD